MIAEVREKRLLWGIEQDVLKREFSELTEIFNSGKGIHLRLDIEKLAFLCTGQQVKIKVNSMLIRIASS